MVKETNEAKHSKLAIWQPFLFAVVASIGMFAGFKMKDAAPTTKFIRMTDSLSYGNPGTVEEIIRYVDAKYVDDKDMVQLKENAIQAVLDELDPHSTWIPEKKLTSYLERMEGEYHGIGADIILYRDTPVVVKMLQECPAREAGLAIHDRIVSVNDSILTTGKRSFNQINGLLKGQKGEILKLIVNRDKASVAIPIEVEIKTLPIESVDVALMLNDDTGIIRILRFSKHTYREFMEQVEKLYNDEGMRNLIIDVRGNPGGYMQEVINIMSQFFEQNDILLVYTEGRNANRIEYKSTGKQFFRIEEIVVLLDENSASGSEIMAGTLQDLNRATIIGRRSFGKGLVQEQYKLSDGSALRLTTSRYYTPSGRSIQKSFDNDTAYDNDYLTRLHSGELFIQDSITSTDTIQYFTKSGKEVFSGMGVIPDVFVAADKGKTDPLYPSFFPLTMEYAYMIFQKNEREFISKSNVEVYEKVDMNNFISWAGLKGYHLPKKEKEILIEALHTDIAGRLVDLVKGTDEMNKFLFNSDPFIEAAKESLSK
jgi:carboxyl-terminal processing protease